MSKSHAAVVFVDTIVNLHTFAESWKCSDTPPVTAQGFIFFIVKAKCKFRFLSLGIFCAVFAAVFLSLVCLDSGYFPNPILYCKYLLEQRMGIHKMILYSSYTVWMLMTKILLICLCHLVFFSHLSLS